MSEAREVESSALLGDPSKDELDAIIRAIYHSEWINSGLPYVPFDEFYREQIHSHLIQIREA
jgi:hypothetical protein